VNDALKLFGNTTRARALIAFALLWETYPREPERLLDLTYFTTQRILNAFEDEGVIVSLRLRNLRAVPSNPRMYGVLELIDLLKKYASGSDVAYRPGTFRRRPRRRGKAI
jgi:hypothetical protein